MDEDCNRVAAQVHDDTTAEAVIPVLTLRSAVYRINEIRRMKKDIMEKEFKGVPYEFLKK